MAPIVIEKTSGTLLLRAKDVMGDNMDGAREDTIVSMRIPASQREVLGEEAEDSDDATDPSHRSKSITNSFHLHLSSLPYEATVPIEGGLSDVKSNCSLSDASNERSPTSTPPQQILSKILSGQPNTSPEFVPSSPPLHTTSRQRSDVFGFPIIRESCYKKWQTSTEKNDLHEEVANCGGWFQYLKPPGISTLSWYGSNGYYDGLKWLSKQYRVLERRQGGVLQSFSEIERDIERTYPGRLTDSRLRSILQAYALRNTNVGYCQGMNYIAALLSRALPSEEEAFWTLCYIAEDVVPDYYRGLRGVLVDLTLLGWMLSKLENCLFQHLFSLGLTCANIFTDHLVCVFALGMPAEAVLRMWREVFRSENPRIYILRLTIGLLSLLKADLLNTSDVSSAVEVLQQGRGGLYAAQCILDVAKFTTDILSDEEIERERLSLMETESQVSGVPYDTEKEKADFQIKEEETQNMIQFYSGLFEAAYGGIDSVLTQSQVDAFVTKIEDEVIAESFTATFTLLTTEAPPISPDSPGSPTGTLFSLTDMPGDVTFRELLLSVALLRNNQGEEGDAASLVSAPSPLPSVSDSTAPAAEDYARTSPFVEEVKGRSPSFTSPSRGEEVLLVRRAGSGSAMRDAEERTGEAQRPYPIPDEDVVGCSVCKRKFNWLIRRRHHCRNCGEVVCAECSPEKTTIPKMDHHTPVRVCSSCYAEVVIAVDLPEGGGGGAGAGRRSSGTPHTSAALCIDDVSVSVGEPYPSPLLGCESYPIPSPTSSLECQRGAD